MAVFQMTFKHLSLIISTSIYGKDNNHFVIYFYTLKAKLLVEKNGKVYLSWNALCVYIYSYPLLFNNDYLGSTPHCE